VVEKIIINNKARFTVNFCVYNGTSGLIIKSFLSLRFILKDRKLYAFNPSSLAHLITFNLFFPFQKNDITHRRLEVLTIIY